MNTLSAATPATPLIGKETCGGCKFGHLLKEDLTQRECFGAPPTPVLMPAKGGMAVTLLRARLPSEHPGCGLWKARLEIVKP